MSLLKFDIVWKGLEPVDDVRTSRNPLTKIRGATKGARYEKEKKMKVKKQTRLGFWLIPDSSSYSFTELFSKGQRPSLMSCCITSCIVDDGKSFNHPLDWS